MTAWWSNERINATVTQEYIERELGSKKYVDTLHGVLAFGDGLTDDTYLDWILERSPRIFLILNQIGAPEKVFEAIDRSFTDDDLPLSQDSLWELNLFGGKSETLDKKFYREQFNFLIQELEPGNHINYSTWDVVPVETTAKRPGISTNTSCDQVRVQNQVYTRKKVATFGDNGIDEVHFIMHLKSLTTIQHPHLVSVWATYSQDEFNYILLTPPTEMTLKAFLDEPPKAFKALEKYERRNIFMTWCHCLTSALASLHDKGFTHQTLRPSAITVDHKNTIYINDYSALKALDIDEPAQPYSSELYDHSAPENWLRKPCLHETAPLKTYLPGGGRTARRIPKIEPENPTSTLPLPPPSPGIPTRKSSKSGATSRSGSKSASSGSSTTTRPRNTVITTFAPPQRVASTAGSSMHSKRAYSSDVFSLTTVLLTLLSMILQHSPKSFASHRCRLNRQAGRGNAPPDASFHKKPTSSDEMDRHPGERGGTTGEEGHEKEPKDRIHSKDLEKKVAGWVDWGLGRKRKCNCICGTGTNGTQEFKADYQEQEPESKYQLLKSNGHSKFRLEEKRKLSLPPAESSVDVAVGSMRGAGISSYQESTVWGLGELSHLHSGLMRPPSIISTQDSLIWGANDAPHFDNNTIVRPMTSGNNNESGIWGLGDAKMSNNEKPYNMSDKRNKSFPQDYPASRADSATTSNIAMGVVGDDEGSEYSGDGSETEQGAETLRADWPLPLGTLTLDHRVKH
ncbi:hypothetical protein JMJ35_002812 [Cladonia borealis]|uniref:Protein kinase domain-containing protein n=1 Tax=Cladonia borealis TaxID=184061 RepID=A0AA39R3L0_9LECA|nr:hypothetical protein JMJ35_002812 [Cladonia borealis]